MNCKCLVINGTGSSIASLTLRHASGLGVPGTYHTVFEDIALAAGGQSMPQNTDQEAGLHDYWDLKVQFQPDGQLYVTSEDEATYISCEVPKDGSMSVTIGPVGESGTYPVTINASMERNFGSDAGSARGMLQSAASIPPMPVIVPA